MLSGWKQDQNLSFGFKPDMGIPHLIWKFWTCFGNSGTDMEILDLKWKFWIRYGNSWI
jgi:hypothetical protein